MRLFTRIIALCSFILTLMVSCEYKDKPGAHRHINFVNNSDKDIYVSYSPYVPNDTLCTEIMQTHLNPQLYKVEAYSANDFTVSLYWNTTWENYISNLTLGAIIVFVHDAVKSDSICTDENINWKWYNDDEKEKLYLFLNEQIILKRYYYTLDDLDKMDWTITYP